MEHLSELITNTHLLGSLLLGILWGSPHVGNLLSPIINATFTLLGYIGLLLLIFAAGLTTPLSLLLNPANLALSILVALTGIALPFALTFGLLCGGYGYTLLQGFGAGAALCSTSLGTTIALLDEDMRTRRIGVVLMTAALTDDVVGLVIAGIVTNLGPDSDTIRWSTIVRPILVSMAYTLLTPAAAMVSRKVLQRGRRCRAEGIVRRAYAKVANLGHIGPSGVHLLVIVTTLTAFVASSHSAGTSELYGAYLAGTFLSYVFEPAPKCDASKDITGDAEPVAASTSARTAREIAHRQPSETDGAQPQVTQPLQTCITFVTEPLHPTLAAFERTIDSVLTNLLSPLFFASIGASLPVQNLFTIKVALVSGAPIVATHAVIWKGIVYSLLMVIAKLGTGVWILLWPESEGEEGFVSKEPNTLPPGTPGGQPPPPVRGSLARRLPRALFLGLAMVSRGEIALIVAQLARPLLTGDNGVGNVTEEPFAVVIWAIILTTICGAVGVGIVLRRMHLK